MNAVRYLLVTHIPFARDGATVRTDGLWALDLAGLRDSVGPIRVAAPELSSAAALTPWGPSAACIGPGAGIEFAGLPPITQRRDLWRWPRVRSILRREVAWADLVHTSNFFPPYSGLYYAHDLAVRTGKKTVFVIAEDFHDMLQWEWVRMAPGPFEAWRRRSAVERMDRRVQHTASTASLTLLHTPAAVLRYRLSARNSIAIRQPGHESGDVIPEAAMAAKCDAVLSGAPLVIASACRHKQLKGLDLLISAVALLRRRGIRVEAKLYGHGESTASLQALTRRLGVAGCVAFPGSLPPGRDVYRAISEAHVFAMPHRTTDFGRAFFDAMAGGDPVIAFATEASMHTVRHEVDGLLAAPDDVEALAAAIERFHADRVLLVRCAQAARHRALCNTRRDWFALRAGWIAALLEEPLPDAAPLPCDAGLRESEEPWVARLGEEVK